MPNNIRNILTINETDSGETTVQDVLDYLKGEPYEDGEPRLIDFNKLKPMPESLNVTCGSIGDTAYRLLKRFGATMERFNEKIEKPRTISLLKMECDFINTDEEAEKAYELGFQYLKNEYEHGHTTWYDWCVEHWGTKWNAYSNKIDGNVVMFDTAWSPVIDLIHLLASRFPDVNFEYQWADEDTGYNVGEIVFVDGEQYGENMPESGSNEAYELAFKIRPEHKQRYKLDEDGNYVYDEDVE